MENDLCIFLNNEVATITKVHVYTYTSPLLYKYTLDVLGNCTVIIKISAENVVFQEIFMHYLPQNLVEKSLKMSCLAYK